MIVIEENAFSILERRLNRIERLILDIKDADEGNLQSKKTASIKQVKNSRGKKQTQKGGLHG